MVVVIQPGTGKALRLRLAKRTERHTGLHPQRFYPLHHLFEVRHIALVRIFPRCAHEKTGRTGSLRFLCRFQHLFNLHQPFR